MTNPIPSPTESAAGRPPGSSPLPLPLATFESLMFLDDRPGYPMTYVLQVIVTGVVDRVAFEAALAATLPRHPLFGATVNAADPERAFWVAAPEARPMVDWNQEGAPIESVSGEAIDLTKEIGLRIWIRQGEKRAWLFFNMHHACADGMGAMRFLEDLLAAYVLARGGTTEPPTLRTLDPDRLRFRGQFGGDAVKQPFRWRDLWVSLREAVKFLVFHPVPLAAKSKIAVPVDLPMPGFLTHVLTDDEVAQLRAAASREDATLNDLFLAAMFEVLRDWNARYGKQKPGDRLQLTMPTDLRSKEDDGMPAANMLSFAFLARQAGDCGDPQRLLQSVRDETKAIKRLRLGTDFVQRMGIVLGIRGALPMILRRQTCLSTAVLSNLGDPTRRFAAGFPREAGKCVVGNLILESLSAAPPSRPLTRAGIAIFSYAGQTHINLKCDPHFFTAADSQELLSAFVERLSNWGAWKGGTARGDKERGTPDF